MKTELPTKPGAYYCREEDVDEWELVIVSHHNGPWATTVKFLSNDCLMDLKYMEGQWLRIPDADELVELQDLKKRVDEGKEAWFVVDAETHEALSFSAETRGMATQKAWEALGMQVQHGCPGGYTCEPVIIVRKEKP